jgi:hypothetical protein
LLALEVVTRFQMFSLSHSQPNIADTVNCTIWMDGDWMPNFVSSVLSCANHPYANHLGYHDFILFLKIWLRLSFPLDFQL